MRKIKKFEKFLPVRIKKLKKDFNPYNTEKLDLYFRKEGQTGIILYPYYETLNNVWCVRHENGTTALYHTDEIEQV